MKAVLQYRATPLFRKQISGLESAALHVAIVDETDRATFDREMQDAEVLLHVLEPVRAATIERAPRLRLIQKLGIGVDTIDLEAARRAGVAVCNMPGTNTRAVAELALLLMLATLRRLVTLDAETRAGNGWSLHPEVVDSFAELGGRTVGLVGFGAVGKCLTPMLQGMGARVLYTDISAAAGESARFVSLDELLSSADVVSLHVPLTRETTLMMNDDRFGSMKPGAILVNTARGRLVDQDALHRALQSGRLRGAGLDVFDVEPADTSHPVFRLPNIVVTPHIAWLTAETLSRSLGVFAENCRRLREGETLLNQVV
jgi:phosphoglycerate dehydrogenase-like enzyme